VIHATGYPSVASAIDKGGAGLLLAAADKALWIMFALQLILMALAAVMASRRRGGGVVVFTCGVVTGAEAMLVFRLAGVFAAALMLAAAAMLLVTGGLFLLRAAKG
jgi:hypothetical protein